MPAKPTIASLPPDMPDRWRPNTVAGGDNNHRHRYFSAYESLHTVRAVGTLRLFFHFPEGVTFCVNVRHNGRYRTALAETRLTTPAYGHPMGRRSGSAVPDRVAENRNESESSWHRIPSAISAAPAANASSYGTAGSICWLRRRVMPMKQHYAA